MKLVLDAAEILTKKITDFFIAEMIKNEGMNDQVVIQALGYVTARSFALIAVNPIEIEKYFDSLKRSSLANYEYLKTLRDPL